MSGNFVQRGEPAIVDKWTRAQMALEAGADLVLELPFLVSVQAADFFAKGAVDILERLGIEHLTLELRKCWTMGVFRGSMARRQSRWRLIWLAC